MPLVEEVVGCHVGHDLVDDVVECAADPPDALLFGLHEAVLLLDKLQVLLRELGPLLPVRQLLLQHLHLTVLVEVRNGGDLVLARDLVLSLNGLAELGLDLFLADLELLGRIEVEQELLLPVFKLINQRL